MVVWIALVPKRAIKGRRSKPNYRCHITLLSLTTTTTSKPALGPSPPPARAFIFQLWFGTKLRISTYGW